MDLPLATVRANSTTANGVRLRKILRTVPREPVPSENSRPGNRETPELFFVGVKCTWQDCARQKGFVQERPRAGAVKDLIQAGKVKHSG